MIVSSRSPIGIIQGYASISEGLWYARSEEFMQQSLFDTLRWVRFGGDVVFIFGALAFFWQIFTMIFFKPKKQRNPINYLSVTKAAKQLATLFICENPSNFLDRYFDLHQTIYLLYGMIKFAFRSILSTLFNFSYNIST